MRALDFAIDEMEDGCRIDEKDVVVGQRNVTTLGKR